MEEKEPYFQVPKSLFRLRRTGGISLTAFDIYVLMLDRYKLSKKNKWVDKEKKAYIIYSYEDLMEDLNVKSKNGISEALKELEELNFLQRKKRYRNSTMFYLKNESTEKDTFIKSESIENHTLTKNESTEKDTSISTENHTFILEKNTKKGFENKEEIKGEITPNKNNINKNNYYISNNNSIECGSSLRNEIRLLIGIRKITVDRILKYCNNIERISEVIGYANKTNKGDGYIISALKENYNLKELDSNENTADTCNAGEKDYSMSIDEALKRSRGKK